MAIEREKQSGRTFELGGLSLAYVLDVVPDQTPDGEAIIYEAHTRYDNPFGRELLLVGMGPFCRFREPGLPHTAGAMLLTVDGGPALLLDAANLNQEINLRFGLIAPRQCYVGGDALACQVNAEVLRAVRNGQVVSLWFRATPNARQAVVRALVRHRQDGLPMPRWNPEITQTVSKDSSS